MEQQLNEVRQSLKIDSASTILAASVVKMWQ